MTDGFLRSVDADIALAVDRSADRHAAVPDEQERAPRLLCRPAGKGVRLPARQSGRQLLRFIPVRAPTLTTGTTVHETKAQEAQVEP